MSGHIPFGTASAREIERHQCQEADPSATYVNVCNFGRHAKLAWPFKTAAQIAAICKISERQAARMLTGEFEPPASVLSALIVEITKRG